MFIFNKYSSQTVLYVNIKNNVKIQTTKRKVCDGIVPLIYISFHNC